MRRVALAFAVGAALLPTPVGAQNTTIGLSGCSCNLGNNTLAAFDNGFQDSATGVTVTVTRATGTAARTVTVFIRSASTTLGSGKPLSDLQWRRSTDPMTSYTAVTTSDALIGSTTLPGTGAPSTFVNTIFFRFLLDWADDAPATYSATVVFTLQVTAP